MQYIGNIQSQASAKVFAIASGTLPHGKPVVVNSDGTVSIPASALVDTTIFNNADTDNISAVFDSNSNKIVIAYRDKGNSSVGTAIVGTIANSAITFGSEVVFENAAVNYVSASFDSNTNRVVISFQDDADSDKGKAIVGTVSGTAISFGSVAVFNAATTIYIDSTFDSNSNKVVIAYRDGGNSNYGTSIVATVDASDNSISFGSEVVFSSVQTDFIKCSFDDNANKVAIIYEISTSGRVKVGTVSGTGISFGTEATFTTNNVNSLAISFDTTANKFAIFYRDVGNSNDGRCRVATISGTDISFGTEVVFYTADSVHNLNAVYNPDSNKTIVVYTDGDGGVGTIQNGTISGTNISFDTGLRIRDGGSNDYGLSFGLAYDTNSDLTCIAFGSAVAAQIGTAALHSSTAKFLTTENFIGFSTGRASPAVTGSATTYEFGRTDTTDIAYIGSDKVVIAYRQHYNTAGSQVADGYCVVGTISGTSISFGTATAFSTDNVNYVHVANAENDKVVVMWQEGANSNYATARVGTVSGTAISFGDAEVAHSGNSAYVNVEGIGNNKVVGTYRDDGDSDKGKAIVGTVSGTDISFGDDAQFNTHGDGYDLVSIGSSKVVIAYKDVGNSGHGTAIVGTVDGTDITFGSEAVYEAATTGNLDTGIAFIGSDKVVISYQDEGNSNAGTAVVGTVSGTSITFGSAVVFETLNTSITNSTSIGGDKVVIVYSQATETGTNPATGKYVVGTVSGTAITFDDAVTFNSAASWDVAVASPADNKVAISWGQHYDISGSRHGQAIVTTIDDRGSTANGNVATIKVGGAVSTIQGGLISGQQYFVQKNGTIDLTADTTSVIAGTALSETELIVKG